jgi:hypothetical protein
MMQSLVTRLTALTRQPVLLFLGIMLGLIFIVYGTYRQKYVGASDWYGYYQEARLLQTGRITLPTELPVAEYPAVVPFGFYAAGNQAVPQYPPGYPVLLALAGFLHLEFFVTPLAGLLSCLFIFLLIRDLTEPWTAAVFTVLWGFFPIVVFSSTTLMSDIVAALGLIASYYYYRRQRLFVSALWVGLSLAVRPTNALYLLVFAYPLLRDRHLMRYGVYLLVPGVLYATYNHVVFGAPWRTGYSDISHDLTSAVFSDHLAFYLRETVRQLSLPLTAFCLIGLLIKPTREKLFYLAWFLAFLLFYCFWQSGGDRWWWTRFLLPGYAPLFLLAALGFAQLRRWLVARLPWPALRVPAGALLLTTLTLLPFRSIAFGLFEQDVWVKHKGVDYRDTVRHVAVLAPAHSYVGSIEFTGALRLYSELQPFVSTHPNAPRVIERVLKDGRQAFLLIEPWNRADPAIRDLLARFTATRLPDIPIWGGLELYRLEPAPPGA